MELELEVSPKGIPTKLRIPLVLSYKYFGVIISRDPSPNAHLQAMKKKINFIVNAFRSIGGANQSLKFWANTWQVFIRPLLDNSQTYFYFLQNYLGHFGLHQPPKHFSWGNCFFIMKKYIEFVRWYDTLSSESILKSMRLQV